MTTFSQCLFAGFGKTASRSLSDCATLQIGFLTPEGSLKREAEFFGCESFAPMSSAQGGETSMLELATMVCEVLPGG